MDTPGYLPPIGFDSIGGLVDQYFKIYQLRSTGVLTVELEDVLIAEAEKGQTVWGTLTKMYRINQSENIKMLLEEISRIEEVNPS